MRFVPPPPLTDAEILAIARRKGRFVVTWHHRNHALRAQALSLRRRRLLRMVASARGEDVYALHRRMALLGRPYCAFLDEPA